MTTVLKISLQGGEVFGLGIAIIGLGLIAFLYFMSVLSKCLKRLVLISVFLEVVARKIPLSYQDAKFYKETIMNGQDENEFHAQNSPGTPND